jgi:hypothetical protein
LSLPSLIVDMVSTRSASKQTHLEDFAEDKATHKAAKSKPAPKANAATKQTKNSTSGEDGMLSPPPSPTRKRKSPPPSKTAKSEKKVKTTDAYDGLIMVNRAPVLHLWGACVTQLLYPQLAWSTCLSAGGAISAICAVAKGRSIGRIKEQSEEKKSKIKDKEAENEEESDVLEVMQFKLERKDDKILFSGAPQGGNEDALRRKFPSGEKYELLKASFNNLLAKWKGGEEGLRKAAFGMYEEFRPNVSKGQKGWGRKGLLDLDVVRKSVEKA